MLEVLQDELFRRGVEVAQVLPALGQTFQQRPLLVHGDGRAIGLGEDDVLDHRLPAAPDVPERGGVLPGIPLDGGDGPLDVGEPAQVGAVEKVLYHPGVGLVVVDAHAFHFEVPEPGQHHQAAVKHRVDVVPEPRIVPVLVGVESPAHLHVLLDHEDLLSGLAQVAGADHAVVPGADHHAVVMQQLRHDSPAFVHQLARAVHLPR